MNFVEEAYVNLDGRSSGGCAWRCWCRAVTVRGGGAEEHGGWSGTKGWIFMARNFCPRAPGAIERRMIFKHMHGNRPPRLQHLRAEDGARFGAGMRFVQ